MKLGFEIKLLLRLVVLIAVLMALPFFLALFIDTEFRVTESVIIERPRHEVYEFLRHLENQTLFNSRLLLDSETKITTRGPVGEVGYVFNWESETRDVGEGEQEILELDPDHRIELEIRVSEPYSYVDRLNATFKELTPTTTEVTFNYDAYMAYPSNLMYLFVSTMISRDMDQSLDNLKELLEKNNPKSADPSAKANPLFPK